MPDSEDVESVERVIAAPPEKVFDLLADPSRHHDIDGSGSVGAVKDGAPRLELGSQFTMAMKRGVSYTMVSTVIEFEEDRRIAWQSQAPSRFASKLGGPIWRYELEPVDGGTLVRESWDLSQSRAKALMRRSRNRTHTAMDQTLARIEELVAS